MSDTFPPNPYVRTASPFRGFQDLMRHRVRDILLVSSLYDAFILAEDNELNELVLDEAIGLGLLHTPRFTRVSTGSEALDLAAKGGYDLIIASTHVADMSALTLARRAVAGMTAAAFGSAYYSLPPGCGPYPYSGYTYYSCGGAYYQPQYEGTTVVYVSVPDPAKGG
jgi:hypothetical protein